MADKNKLKVGMTVWKLGGTISNPHLSERKISKVGRKYFYVAGEKFNIETLQLIDSYFDGRIYLDKQEYINKVRKETLIRDIKAKYNKIYSLSLTQLEEINKIINKEEI